MSDDKHRSDVLGGAIAGGVAVEWVHGLNAAVRSANDALLENARRSQNRNLSAAQGFFAEQWHASTFNVDAYKKGIRDLVASVPESTAKASPDVQIHLGEELIENVQSKYYKSAGDTARQMWNPDYSGGGKVVPADQLAAAQELSQLKASTDARPHVREAAQHSADRMSDRISADGVESKPLGRRESDDLTAQARRGEDVLRTADVLSGKEIAMNAAKGGLSQQALALPRPQHPRFSRPSRPFVKGKGSTTLNSARFS